MLTDFDQKVKRAFHHNSKSTSVELRSVENNKKEGIEDEEIAVNK
jgi:hypothetical protein